MSASLGKTDSTELKWFIRDSESWRWGGVLLLSARSTYLPCHQLLVLKGPCPYRRWGTAQGPHRRHPGFHPPPLRQTVERLDRDRAESKTLKGIIKETDNCKWIIFGSESWGTGYIIKGISLRCLPSPWLMQTFFFFVLNNLMQIRHTHFLPVDCYLQGVI